MDIDNNDEWLREFAAQERAEDLSHTPPFERVWRAAERRSGKRSQACVGLAPKLIFGLAAVILTVGVFMFWNNSETSKNRRTECELAALDSVLVTYWEAPSDVLLEPLSSSLSGQTQ